MSGKMTDNREAVAIIGMACIFPQAPDKESFWHNILNSVSSIGEPLPEWEAKRYLESNRINTPNGGYLKDLYRFNPQEFGIMPNSVDGGEPDHFLALQVARDALLDAGYLGEIFDHQDTGIILGHSTYLHRGQGNHIQHHIILDQTLELLQTVFPALGEERASEIRRILKDKLPQCGVDIAPGLVPNVMTGRIANRLNLKGPNYLVDAACSSSLLAVNASIDELRNGRSRMMLAGGVNASLPAEVSLIFNELGALSKRGQVCPFGADSDGTLLGEGLGIVVLKRVSDAISDGDRIYALIRGVGQSSDGKGHGLLAPSVDGEALAIERAYANNGVDPSTVELLEAHGTGIPLGDKTEISALKKVFGERRGRHGSVAIGSIKSMISHCIPAAGVAGLIKSALALHHKILPPTLCDRINPELGIEKTPLYINTQARPWITRPGQPRRAGINSFGFGGINTHAILEEASEHAIKPLNLNTLPFELCVFTAQSREDLIERLKSVAGVLVKCSGCRLGEIAAALYAEKVEEPYRLAMVVKSVEDLNKKITQALKRFNKKEEIRWSTRNGVVFSSQPINGKIAFMFPGEGSQYIEMFTDLALYFDEVRDWFDFWRGLYNDAPGDSRTDIIFPPKSELTEQRRKELELRIHDMDVGSEAAFIGGQAMNALLTAFGVEADVMVGHSTGESSALAAAGAIGSGDMLQLSEFVKEMNRVYRRVLDAGNIPTGALLTVGALSRDVIEQNCELVDKDIVVAMENCSNQLVLFGPHDSIEKLQSLLGEAGGICALLPFDRGYHTPLFATISEAFKAYYEEIELKVPEVPLYSCASAELFPNDNKAVRSLAAEQWSTKVRFAETVSKMYQEGAKYFLEVGPSGNLSAFVNDILAGKEYLTLATNLRRKNSLEQMLFVLAQLYVNDKKINLDRLFDSRTVNNEGFADLTQSENQGQLLLNTMPIIHLTKEEGEAVRNLLPVSADSTDVDYREAIHEGDSHNNEVRESSEQESETITGGEQVMLKYFDLMHDFLTQQNTFMEKIADSEKEPQTETLIEETIAPLLDKVTTLDENQCIGQCHLSVFEDNFLQNHILSGTVSQEDPELLGLSCVPFMVSLEIMAEACALVAGRKDITLIENVKTYDWIALDQNQLMLDVEATRLSSDPDKIRANIFNSAEKIITADFSFEPQLATQKMLTPLAEQKEYRWKTHELYSTGMFHGPLFQSIKNIDGWDDTGIDASLSEVSLEGFFVEGETPHLLLNPVLLDAVGQLAAYWIAQQVGTDFNSFPASIDRIELYTSCPQDVGGVTLQARQQPLNPVRNRADDPKAWQFECYGSGGELLLRVSNLLNVFFRVPHRFYEFRRDPLHGRLGGLYPTMQEEDIVLWQLDHLPENFCAQSGGIFLRILANGILSGEERSLWYELSGKNIRYQRQWLLGKACIKEAVQWWIYQQTGEQLYLTDIIVRNDDYGKPYVGGWWQDTLVVAPEVSLSHDQKMVVAGVSGPHAAIGVDIEQIERSLKSHLVMGALNEHERFALNNLDGEMLNETLLRFLCAKEAAAKYLGLGLQGQPEKYEVHIDNNDWEQARVVYNDTVTNVKVHREDGTIIAVAIG